MADLERRLISSDCLRSAFDEGHCQYLRVQRCVAQRSQRAVFPSQTMCCTNLRAGLDSDAQEHSMCLDNAVAEASPGRSLAKPLH